MTMSAVSSAGVRLILTPLWASVPDLAWGTLLLPDPVYKKNMILTAFRRWACSSHFPAYTFHGHPRLSIKQCGALH